MARGDPTAEGRRRELVFALQAVAGGDREALRDIYERTGAKLFGVCLRILGSREEAEDVLQDVYLTVWNKAHSFDAQRASPITWLATIARNRAIDRRRSTAPRLADRPMEDAFQVPDLGPDALDALESGDEARRLKDCLGQLEPRTRDAIVSAFYGGRTYEDLAETGGQPLGTVKSTIRRGLIRLRGCLET
ncbi:MULTISPECIES: sigma-70 family RNA polymerase sigma factor [unclassified Aureimonas]|uniref:sigma-70 family RNA polymerase sigma factor n=1 Tax=unclassified Aureimonas TaxID=2615206 RepID=UPI0006F27A79|nr:sigma-70 family RNA polymerase sigma factor [Aureimonas sp. Leaf427]KQT64232.1 RNA polymerase subunit sigma [Aureimonas sp. Leaf427]KQT81422.1 RNA polymerase subunit sigma [Aureimonas sp. Leaf460]